MSDTSSSNAHEYTVSEISGALKRTVEDTYGHVRVRGELGRVTVAKSGHVYLDLKDEKAALDGVMWKGMASMLNFKPEEGLEIIAEGRLSTFPGRSKYQMIIDRMEPAGEGALMALLEARKKKLAAAGLFAAERKRELPFLPRVIGVVTSPTGAVIRDILHRLEDRFPVHVLLWPVLVQGDKAADQITAAIEGFNQLTPDGAIPVPDLLIVARGGGSIEDLWCFNEENVVCAAAASRIPLISAVGHETDTTLIDFASDQRAPTPTGAAEMAVPVRRELLARSEESGGRIRSALLRALERKVADLKSAARALPRPDILIGEARQRFDLTAAKLEGAAKTGLDAKQSRLAVISGRMHPSTLKRDVTERRRRFETLSGRLSPAFERDVSAARQRLEGLSARLDSVSHASVLKRGFALVKDADGKIVRSAAALQDGQSVAIELGDGIRAATIGELDLEAQNAPPKRTVKTPKPKSKPKPPAPDQGSLF